MYYIIIYHYSICTVVDLTTSNSASSTTSPILSSSKAVWSLIIKNINGIANTKEPCTNPHEDANKLIYLTSRESNLQAIAAPAD